MQLSEVHKEILVECASDDVGLWEIIARVNHEGYSKFDILPGVREKTLEIIRDLLSAGLVYAGFPRNDGKNFEISPMSPNQTMKHIESEWDKLGHMPTLGDIIWFRATPNGKKIATEIQKKSAVET